MTGPEHYKAAEAALRLADDGAVDWESLTARAQVHATLALVMSFADAVPTSQWQEVTS